MSDTLWDLSFDPRKAQRKLDPFGKAFGRSQWHGAVFKSIRRVQDPLLGAVLAAFGMEADGSDAPFIARVLGPGQRRSELYQLKLLSTWLTVDAIGQGKGAGFEGAAVVPEADLWPCDCLMVRCGYRGEQKNYALWTTTADGIDILTERELRMALASPFRQRLHGVVLPEHRNIDLRGPNGDR